MSVIEIVRFTAKAGRGDEFGDRLKNGLTVHAADPNCTAITLLRSVERPDEYLAEITWTSIEAHDAWREAHRDEWRAKVGWEIVEGGPQGLKHYTLVGRVKE